MAMPKYTALGKLAKINLEGLKSVIVVGDLHGDLQSLRRVEALLREGDLLVFLGDYGDRGPDGVGVIEGVRRLMEENPGRVIPLKGNHEDYSDDGDPRFYPCTLPAEVEDWGFYFKDLKRGFLDKLYLAAVVPGLALFVHGGISTKVKSAEDLISPNRKVEEDVIWSDPWSAGERRNPRGAGVLFGPEVSAEVAGRLGVNYFVRSHEPAKALAGPKVEHNGRIVTISSTRVYGGRPFVLALPVDKFPRSGIGIEDYATYL